MKVTVTFGDTAVVVPCKDGWTVRDVTDQATRRYRKILEKAQHLEYVVRIHHVEYDEGGILDMDDPITDLLEDKDRLVAVFEEEPRGRASSPEGSVASNGHASPAPFLEPLQYNSHFMPQQPIRAEIEVNEAVLKSNTPLLVRSSSDSALAPPLEVMAPPPHEDLGAPDADVHSVLKGALDRTTRQDQPTGKMPKVNFSPLTKTVAFSGDQGPLGIHVVPYNSSLSGRSLGLHIKGIEPNSRSRRDGIFQEDECIVQINDTPLLDKTFAESQEAFRQVLGSPRVRLQVLSVANKPRYEKSLIGQLFTGDAPPGPAPTTDSPQLLRPAPAAAAAAKPGPPAPPKTQVRPKTPDPSLEPLYPAPGARGGAAAPSAGRGPHPTPTPPLPAAGPRGQSPPPATVPRGGGLAAPPPATGRAPRATPTPPLPAVGPRGQTPPPPAKGPVGAGPRKGGKRLNIELQKGSEGLGFTVVTRDSALHGPGPILVKNILPRGAAIRDGRLQPGDRILEVNGVDMTIRTQEQLVGLLRSTRQGESVFLVVARPEEGSLPRELKGEASLAGGALLPEDGWEQLVYEVPLSDSGSAGLGVSLKGNRSRETGEDLGIFIKSIIHGGAAHKDGRLRVNDQLLAVNGEALQGQSNNAAMETLRRSMSSEGNARGTIQLVLLRPTAQTSTSQSGGSANAAAANGYQDANSNAANQVFEEPVSLPTRGPDGPPGPHPHRQGPLRGPSAYSDPRPGQPSPSPQSDGYEYGRTANAGSYPQNGGRYDDDFDDDDEEEAELTQAFPPPPSPGVVAEIKRQLPAPPHSEDETGSFEEEPAYRLPDRDPELLSPRSRASKSMDLVADESNVGSLAGPRKEPGDGDAVGPTLGLWKSSSLESLQTAVSEARHQRPQDGAPFHRPPPAVVRGRTCNQSFRLAIDRSYEGPSEDDDDLSEQSSGRDTAASGSSRQELDADVDRKQQKKTKGKKKKEKKSKGKKKAGDESSEDPEKKTKRLGFGLLRFGRKKEDKKNKMVALSEEEAERTVDPRSVRPTPEGSLHSIPDMEDDDSDPNYARINFNKPPSPKTTSLPPVALAHAPPSGPYRPPEEDLEGLYAKVNKPKPSHQALSDSEPPRHQGQQRREYQPARPAPSYEELDLGRRRGPETDPQRMAPRGADSRPTPPYEDLDRQPATNTRRRDPYDYPTHSRPPSRDPLPYSDPPPALQAQRGRQPEAPQQYHHTAPRPGRQQQRQPRQDAPPYPTSRGGDGHHYESVGELRSSASRDASPERYPPPGYADPDRYEDRDGYGKAERYDRYGHDDRYARVDRTRERKRSASTERYVEPDRYASHEERYGSRERSASMERYASAEPYDYRDEGRRPDPRQKNPLIGAV